MRKWPRTRSRRSEPARYAEGLAFFFTDTAMRRWPDNVNRRDNLISTSIRTLGPVALLATMIVAGPAIAATATDSIDVSATVTSNCIVAANPIAFGDVDVTSGSNVDGSGTISVTCTSGTAWAATADAGVGVGATLGARKMTSGANLLDYSLYTDSAGGTLWGDGTTGSAISDTGSGSAQSKTFYGRVPSGQASLPSGAYADTVTVTVTYL